MFLLQAVIKLERLASMPQSTNCAKVNDLVTNSLYLCICVQIDISDGSSVWFEFFRFLQSNKIR